jgi:hypothetical protein
LQVFLFYTAFHFLNRNKKLYSKIVTLLDMELSPKVPQKVKADSV